MLDWGLYPEWRELVEPGTVGVEDLPQEVYAFGKGSKLCGVVGFVPYKCLLGVPAAYVWFKPVGPLSLPTLRESRRVFESEAPRRFALVNAYVAGAVPRRFAEFFGLNPKCHVGTCWLYERKFS